MVGVRSCVATSTHVWPAIRGLPGPPLRGGWMIQSGGGRLLLIVPLRIIKSGASGLISPIYARVVLRPFLLVFPRMIQSWALHGLVSALLHYHGTGTAEGKGHEQPQPPNPEPRAATWRSRPADRART